MAEPDLLIILGFFVGAIGTLIGAGGGFIMVPVLLILYPSLSSETLTGMSLVIVCCNAISGSVAYAYRKRIDYRSVVFFSIAATPGAIVGSYVTSLIPRKSFEFIFGFVMIFISIYLLVSKSKNISLVDIKNKLPIRTLIDREGKHHSISYSLKLGVILSAVVGFFSSLLGIGGGIIHVPTLVRWLNFPVHIATATSHAILAVISFVGVIEHLVRGDLNSVVRQIAWLALSVVVGAQLGAHLSHRAKDSLIIKALAVALLTVGIRFVFL